jgi:hypothetical protein
MKAIDCAANASKVIPALKKAGISVVIRYFGAPSWKNATKSECVALRKADLDLAAVYETTATMMLLGHPAGVSGAKTAKAAIVVCGGPADAFIYFACDTATENHAAIEAYLAGAAEVLGKDKVGIYGSYDVCDHALKAHAAAKAWQTLAWSDGKRLASASLYQHNGSKEYGSLGISYDVDYVLATDVGQWGYKAPVTPPVMEPAYNRVVTFAKAYIRLNPNVHSHVEEIVHKSDKLIAIPGGTVLWALTTRGFILRTRIRKVA